MAKAQFKTVFKLFIEIIMWNCMYINSSLEKSSSENENNSYASIDTM